MTTRAFLTTMLGAGAVLAGTLAPALAHTITVKNCTSRNANFYAFNQDDDVYLQSASEEFINQQEQASLHCDASEYCKVFAFDTASPHHRVTESITFYTASTVNDFIDADGSQRP